MHNQEEQDGRLKDPLESVAATGSTISLMSEKRRIVGVTGGAAGLSALALAFGVCCVAPVCLPPSTPGRL